MPKAHFIRVLGFGLAAVDDEGHLLIVTSEDVQKITISQKFPSDFLDFVHAKSVPYTIVIECNSFSTKDAVHEPIDQQPAQLQQTALTLPQGTFRLLEPPRDE